MRAGADANAANDLGATPLWLAAQNGSAAMTRRLLQAGADPNKALLAGETPMMVAARAGNAEVVDLLAAKGANLNARATRGQTALMWAVAQKHPAVVKVLIARGADIHARSDAWSQVMAVFPHGILDYNRPIPHGRDTALLFAARAGDLESAKLLVDAGANVNDEDAWGVSATVLAAHSGFADLVAFLLDRGADPERRAGRLHRAARGDHAPRREDGGGAPGARRRRQRAPRHLDTDAPIVARLELRAGARRRDAVLAGGAFRAAEPDAPARRSRRRSAGSSITRRITPAIRRSRAATRPPH